MIEEMIAEMGPLFRKGTFTKTTSFCFTLDDTAISIVIDAESYTVERGAPAVKPDCSCQTSAEIFRKIWYDGYKPGIMEFISGAIRSDAPLMLPQFLKAFGK